MSEWQPIETAPKDGTKVLIYWDGDIWQGQYVSEDRVWETPSGEFAWSDEITHWMPLPDPPKEQA